MIKKDDRDSVALDCYRCSGSGHADASGFPCSICGGKGYTVHKKPKRDYEAYGRRAFEKGHPISDNPYRYGWPRMGWMSGWIDARDDAANVPENRRLNLFRLSKEFKC